ncbi:MerR family transcriptional regulator [Jatrophihabitans sp. DSM 45814]
MPANDEPANHEPANHEPANHEPANDEPASEQLASDVLAGQTETGVPIAHAADQLGVPIPTLRSWELRYAITQSSRTPGRHRRYTARELQALRLMRDEIAAGKRARVAAQSARDVLGVAGLASGFVEEFLVASHRSDPRGVTELLTRAERTLGIGACIDDVMFPAMREVGLRWRTGECEVEEERLTTEVARGWLEGLAAFAPAPNQTAPVVLACGPADRHSLGLEALAVLLRYRARSCWLLGSPTSVRSLRTALRANAAAGIVIASHLRAARNRAVESVLAAAEFSAPLFYAGNAFVRSRDRAGLPGTYLGTRLQRAAATIETTLARGGVQVT